MIDRAILITVTFLHLFAPCCYVYSELMQTPSFSKIGAVIWLITASLNMIIVMVDTEDEDSNKTD